MYYIMFNSNSHDVMPKMSEFMITQTTQHNLVVITNTVFDFDS